MYFCLVEEMFSKKNIVTVHLFFYFVNVYSKYKLWSE